MHKCQDKIKKISFYNIEKLKTVCKMINEIISGIKYWKFDCIWPINLYLKTLGVIEAELQEVIFFASDIS